MKWWCALGTAGGRERRPSATKVTVRSGVTAEKRATHPGLRTCGGAPGETPSRATRDAPGRARTRATLGGAPNRGGRAGVREANAARGGPGKGPGGQRGGPGRRGLGRERGPRGPPGHGDTMAAEATILDRRPLSPRPPPGCARRDGGGREQRGWVPDGAPAAAPPPGAGVPGARAAGRGAGAADGGGWRARPRLTEALRACMAAATGAEAGTCLHFRFQAPLFPPPPPRPPAFPAARAQARDAGSRPREGPRPPVARAPGLPLENASLKFTTTPTAAARDGSAARSPRLSPKSSPS